MENAYFLKHCTLWAESNIPYHFEHKPTQEEIKLHTIISFIISGHKTTWHQEELYSKAYEWAIFDHAYKEIFTIYSFSPNALIKHPPHPTFHMPGHITRTLNYEPHITDQLLPLICPILIISALLLTGAAIYIPWIAPVCSIILIIIYTLWWRRSRKELEWKAQMAIAITIWGPEINKLMESPAFLSWACYKYQTDKLNHTQKKLLRNFIRNHHLWPTTPSATTP